jgi:hypothetical protein
MTATNRTQTTLGPQSSWPGTSIELNDLDHPQGGRRIYIYGTGHAVVQVVSPGGQERRYEFMLDEAQIRRLLELCIQHDLATIKPARRSGQRDAPRTRIRVISRLCDLAFSPVMR